MARRFSRSARGSDISSLRNLAQQYARFYATKKENPRIVIFKSRTHTGLWEEVRDRLNQKLRGWKEYFRLGNPWKAYQVLDEQV